MAKHGKKYRAAFEKVEQELGNVEILVSIEKNPLASVRAASSPTPEMTTSEMPLAGIAMPITCPVALAGTTGGAASAGDVGTTRPQFIVAAMATISQMMGTRLIRRQPFGMRLQSSLHREIPKSPIV